MFRSSNRSTTKFQYPSTESRDKALKTLDVLFPGTLFISHDDDVIIRQNSGSVNYDMNVAKEMEKLGGVLC